MKTFTIKNHVVIIDDIDEDFCKKYKWRINGDGYVLTTIDNKTFSLHQILMPCPPLKHIIHHVNGNKLDNRSVNLKYVTYSENGIAFRKLHINNTTGTRGVYFENGSYRARIKINQKTITIGRYKTREEAEKAITNFRGENGITI